MRRQLKRWGPAVAALLVAAGATWGYALLLETIVRPVAKLTRQPSVAASVASASSHSPSRDVRRTAAASMARDVYAIAVLASARGDAEASVDFVYEAARCPATAVDLVGGPGFATHRVSPSRQRRLRAEALVCVEPGARQDDDSESGLRLVDMSGEDFGLQGSARRSVRLEVSGSAVTLRASALSALRGAGSSFLSVGIEAVRGEPGNWTLRTVGAAGPSVAVWAATGLASALEAANGRSLDSVSVEDLAIDASELSTDDGTENLTESMQEYVRLDP